MPTRVHDGPRAAGRNAAAPADAAEQWLQAWRAGRQDAVLGELAAVRPTAPPGDVVQPRVDCRAAMAVLRRFLDRLSAPAASAALDRLIARHPNCRHALALRAERAIAAGCGAAAIADLRRALALGFDDLHVQGLLIAANAQLPPPQRSPEMAAAAADLAGRFCPKPFSHFETTPNGDVYVCCPSYLPVPIGNVHRGTIEEIWHSPTAQALRRSIRDGDFRWCSRLSCPAIQAAALPQAAAAPAVTAERGPSFVNLSHDRSCNLTCPSCRTQTIVAKPEEQAGLDRVRDRVVLPVLKTAARVWITGSGDPFGSKHFRDVLDHLNPAAFPGLRVDLQTNAQLFNAREWQRLAGLHTMIGQVYVSIDAAEPATYAEVRRGGSFERLCANMAFVADLRRAGRIRELVIAFVVQACNFRQMPAFVERGRQWGVDGVSFSRLRQWGTYSPEDFARRDVFAPGHPDHAALREVLKLPVLHERFVWLGNVAAF